MSSLIVVTGPPGAGKSTIARALARSHQRAVHLHSDDFWHAIVSGGVPPYEPGADEQNHVVLDVVAGAAWTYASGGFTAVVDGIVGPWMLNHFLDDSRRNHSVPLHYVVLRPDRATTLRRAQARTAPALVDDGPVLHMWDQFADLGVLERHVLDTSQHDPTASLAAVISAVNEGDLTLE